MTQEDREIYELGSHRSLRQELSPPCQLHVKKKKLVNFKISLRRRSTKEEQYRRSSTGSITLPQRPEGRKNSVTFLQDECEPLETLRESHEPRSDSILQRQGTKTTKERREAFRSTGEQRMAYRMSQDRRSTSTTTNLSLSRDQDFRNDNDDSRDTDMTLQCDEDLSKVTQHSLNLNAHRRNSQIEPDVNLPTRTTPVTTCPTKTISFNSFCTVDSLNLNSETVHRRRNDFSRSCSVSSTENWNKIKTVATPKSSRINSLVEMLITRRKVSLAPSIWTPSVPRSLPGPRPANFQDQVRRM